MSTAALTAPAPSSKAAAVLEILQGRFIRRCSFGFPPEPGSFQQHALVEIIVASRREWGLAEESACPHWRSRRSGPLVIAMRLQR